MFRIVGLVSILLACSGGVVHAQCAVQPWSLPYYGSNTSTSMTAGSGQPCQIYPSVGGGNIITSVTISAMPANGTASANGGDAVTYQSRPGFTGQDSFTFTISGSGPGGAGSSAVQVGVNVQ